MAIDDQASLVSVIILQVAAEADLLQEVMIGVDVMISEAVMIAVVMIELLVVKVDQLPQSLAKSDLRQVKDGRPVLDFLAVEVRDLTVAAEPEDLHPVQLVSVEAILRAIGKT